MADLLLVDDDEDLGDVVAEILTSEGHTLRVARDGRQALDLITERRPDLVILDVEMPLMNGPEAAYMLFLRNCGDEEIPIVLVSGIVDFSRVATMVGTPYFLAKPYDIAALINLIDRALMERIPPKPQGRP